MGIDLKKGVVVKFDNENDWWEGVVYSVEPNSISFRITKAEYGVGLITSLSKEECFKYIAKLEDKKVALFFYSKSDIIAKSFIEAGWECHLFDMKSKTRREDNTFYWGGDIREHRRFIGELIRSGRVKFCGGFPPCTDLAVSGARHFANKAQTDAFFWAKAMEHVDLCIDMFEAAGCPWFIENPKSMIATLRKKADHKFNPCDFGGYLPEDHVSLFSDIYPSQDAYKKETWLWVSEDFKFPELKPVEPVGSDYPGWKKLGGKSERTKEIRSLTPEGFARAIFEANVA